MTPDRELLQRYVQQGDEAAFAEVVRHQADLVYSVALRVTANPALAQDVTQTVFTKLVRQARGLSQYDTLVGWLHTTTRHSAIDAIRGEARRRAREQEASTMHLNEPASEMNWEAIAPLLDEAVGSLREDDRKAVLLRFFQNRSHQEIGAELGLTENSANKRIERALEKLRGYFSSRGISATAAILAETISANSVQAAPAGVAARTAKASLAGATSAGLGWAFLKAIFLMNTKIKAVLALAVVIVIAAAVALNWPSSNPVAASAPLASPAKTEAPKVPATPVSVASAQIEAPKAAPAPAPVASPTSVPLVIADPQGDLDSTIVDMTNQLQTGNLFDVFKKYLSPKVMAQIRPEILPKMEQQINEALADPGSKAQMDMMIQGLIALKAQAPTINAAGDLATYTIQPPSGSNLPGTRSTASVNIRFTKIDGKWYIASIPVDMVEIDGKWHLSTRIGPNGVVAPRESN